MMNRHFESRLGIFAMAGLLVCLTICPTFADAHASQKRSLALSMTGVWGWSAQSCNKPGDDGRVNIRRTTVEFFASSYDLKKIRVRADGVFVAHAIVHEEGEEGTGQGNIVLKQLRQNRLSIWTDAAGDHTY